MTIASLESIRNTERWTEDALCAQVDVGDVFFPNRGESPAEAKRICHGCNVKAQCLEWAMEHNEVGVWGELSEKERKALKRTRGLLRADDNRCNNGHDLAVAGVYPSGYCRQCGRDRELRYKARVRGGLVPSSSAHGTRSRYQSGCGCDPCAAAENTYQRRRRGRPLSLGPGAGQ